jgi:putative peptidoglycan lipid II flippase
MAAYSLMAYSLGLPAFILIKILATGFYARQDTRTPVRIGIQAMILNMVLNVLFVVSMLHYDFIAPHVGLALATSASAYFNAAMLALTLKRDSIIESSETFAMPVLKILIACCAMSLVILWLSPTPDSWAQWLWFDRVYQLALLIVPGFLCYTIMLWIMGLRRNQFAN